MKFFSKKREATNVVSLKCIVSVKLICLRTYPRSISCSRRW